MSLDFPPPDIPDGVSIMKQFQIAGMHINGYTHSRKTTGVINMIRPDGTQPARRASPAADQRAMGRSIDGNDDVWVGNFWVAA